VRVSRLEEAGQIRKFGKGFASGGSFFPQNSNEQSSLPMTLSNALIARKAKKIFERW
jgi:hypothetical protein